MIFIFFQKGGGRQKKTGARAARIMQILEELAYYSFCTTANQPPTNAWHRKVMRRTDVHFQNIRAAMRRAIGAQYLPGAWCALHMELVANNTSATIAADRGTFWRPTQRCYQRPTIFEMSIGGVSGHAVGALRWLIQLRSNSRPQVYANRQEGARAHATPAVFSHAAERPNFTAIFRLAAGHTQHPAPKCMR